MVDENKLNEFVGQMLSDLGGEPASIALVRIGDALGLYKILHAKGPMTVKQMAWESGVNERYMREWLSHQVASNYVSYYHLNPELHTAARTGYGFRGRGQPGVA